MTAPIQPTPDSQSVLQALLGTIGQQQPTPAPKPSLLEMIQTHMRSIPELAQAASRDATATTAGPKPGDDLTSIAQAKWELANLGITETQRAKAYRGRVSDAAYANITPYGYTEHGGQLVRTLAAIITPKTIDTNADHARGPRDAGRGMPNDVRDDAWRLYLGLPQANNSFGISDHRPSKSKETKPYFKINGLEQSALFQHPATLKLLVEEIADDEGRARTLGDQYANVMGDFKFDRGVDTRGSYVSYYDVWDLAHPAAQFVGHPFEIYDRVYYDPKTFRVIPNAASMGSGSVSSKMEAPPGRSQ